MTPAGAEPHQTGIFLKTYNAAGIKNDRNLVAFKQASERPNLYSRGYFFDHPVNNGTWRFFGL